MAEREVYSNVEASSTMEELQGSVDRKESVQGESLLLPLLQELLDKKAAHTSLLNRSGSSQSSEESATATADSGTESGEDLRFLAAGLCDSMDVRRSGAESLGPGLLAEVYNALTRLSISLQLDSPEVQMEPTKKQSLMQLVEKLQATLVVPEQQKPPKESKLIAQPRFTNRRSRQNRHTVGVSSEELAAARKLLEEGTLRDNISSSATPEIISTPVQLEKQLAQSHFRPVHFQPATSVKNVTAKPFMNGNAPDSYNAAGQSIENDNEDEPLIYQEPAQVHYRDKKYKNYRQSYSLENENVRNETPKRPFSESVSFEYDINKNNSLQEESCSPLNYCIGIPPKEFQEINTDEDYGALKPTEYYQEEQLENVSDQTCYIADCKQNMPTNVPDANEHANYLETSNNYSVNPELQEDNEEEEDVSSAQRLLHMMAIDSNDKSKKFSKKLKMKRANTIDIPKPLDFRPLEDESDADICDNEEPSKVTKTKKYLSFRGPIWTDEKAKTIVPEFVPKTDNDKKFMAFIKKHNSNEKVGSLWSANEPTKTPVLGDQNWSRKFGHIKTVFEKGENKLRSSSENSNSARKFWQSADNAVHAGKKSFAGPVLSKHGTRHLQNVFEKKQEKPKLAWSTHESNNVVTGTLKVESHFKPIQNNQIMQGKNYKFVPQPLPVNKFSHAPMSAFKPLPKKIPPIIQDSVQEYSVKPTSKLKASVKRDVLVPSVESDVPLYLYRPKQTVFAKPEEEQKPSSSAPWTSTKSDHRVLSIAAKKFENQYHGNALNEPKKSRNKPSNYQQKAEEEMYHVPKTHKPAQKLQQIVKGAEPNRKLSGQYDNISQNKLTHPIQQHNCFTPDPKSQKSLTIFDYPSPIKQIENINMISPSQFPSKELPIFDYSVPRSNDEVIQHTIQECKMDKPLAIFDFPTPESTPPPTEIDESEDEIPSSSLTEYTAVAKVMSGPVSQQAVTTQNGPKRREEHDMAALNVHNLLRRVNFAENNENVLKKSTKNKPLQDSQQITEKNGQKSDKSTKTSKGNNQPIKIEQIKQNNQLPNQYDCEDTHNSSVIRRDNLNICDKTTSQYNTPKNDAQSSSNAKHQHQGKSVKNSDKNPKHQPRTNIQQPNDYYENTYSSKYYGNEPHHEYNNTALEPTDQNQYYSTVTAVHQPNFQIGIETTPAQSYIYDNETDQSDSSSQYHQGYQSSPNTDSVNDSKIIYNLQHPERKQTYHTTSDAKYQSNDTHEKSLNSGTTRSSRDNHELQQTYKDPYNNRNDITNTAEYRTKKAERENYDIPRIPKFSETPESGIKSYYQAQYAHTSDNDRKTYGESLQFNPITNDDACTTQAENFAPEIPFHYEEYNTTHSRPKYDTNSNVKRRLSFNENQMYENPQHQFNSRNIAPRIHLNEKPMLPDYKTNDYKESVITPKLQIPVNKILKNTNSTVVPVIKEPVENTQCKSPIQAKADHWYQLTAEKQVFTKPSPRASPRTSPQTRNALQKAKSSHNLAVPKQFEAGIPRNEAEHKKKTVMAYFGGEQPLAKTSSSSNLRDVQESAKVKLVPQQRQSSHKSTVNRIKTSQKMSNQTRVNPLSRSQTMPDVLSDTFDDLEDIDTEFENIFRAAVTK